MPGWHKAASELSDPDQLVLLGVIQEQHAERCRLFAQWKQFKFPILQDSMTEIGLGVVPVAVLIDEHGVVRSTRFRSRDLQRLVDKKWDKPANIPDKIADEEFQLQLLVKQLETAADAEKGAMQIKVGDAYLRSGEQGSAAKAIGYYDKARESLPETSDKKALIAALDFRTGVAYRMQFDEANGASQNVDDFQKATQYWTQALSVNPRQYIWRRRIEQYGARLIKPYPFYDWVAKAEEEIRARGEQPIKLKVPLTGSEIAKPAKKLAATAVEANPDPKNTIEQETSRVEFQSNVVPSNVKAGATVRIYLRFRPLEAKWNNESAPMQIWVNEPKSGAVEKKLYTIADATNAVSDDPRWIEFEMQVDKDLAKDAEEVELSGFAVFNICDSEDGTCVFRRKDFKLQIPVSR